MLEIKNVSKRYLNKDQQLFALKDITLTINPGEIFGVIGMSGAGKSTLLRSIANLEDVDSGDILIDGINMNKLTENEKRKFRKNIGIVFQGYNLLTQKNVFDNIAFPLVLAKYSKKKIEERVNNLIKLVDLENRKDAFPSQLSGGQCQRVAIARALANNPKILLLDELTSALDPITTKQILNLLKEINDKHYVTMLLISHEMGVISSITDRVAVLNYGEIVEIGNTSEVLNNPQSMVTKMIIGKE